MRGSAGSEVSGRKGLIQQPGCWIRCDPDAEFWWSCVRASTDLLSIAPLSVSGKTPERFGLAFPGTARILRAFGNRDLRSIDPVNRGSRMHSLFSTRQQARRRLRAILLPDPC